MRFIDVCVMRWGVIVAVLGSVVWGGGAVLIGKGVGVRITVRVGLG